MLRLSSLMARDFVDILYLIKLNEIIKLRSRFVYQLLNNF